MGKYFGTDGVRGEYGKKLTAELSFKIGNSLAKTGRGLKFLIGKDTRKTGDVLELAFACGVISAGSDVTCVGICPTAGVSFLTKHFGFDFGIVISASHNPSNYNGIKIFDKSGKKIDENFELFIEEGLNDLKFVDFSNVGKLKYDENLVEEYYSFLNKLFDFDMSKKKIVLDMANGASFKIAKRLFENKGATVISIGDFPNGVNINLNCGATNVEKLKNEVLKTNSSYGFAYDGDSDRLIAIDENGMVVDGDKLLYIFANFYKFQGKLESQKVVGTVLTNMGLELALAENKIKLERVKVGDRNISEKLERENLLLGGEQAGHIIIGDIMPTGDGILSSLLLAFIVEYMGEPLSKLCDFELFKQVNLNIQVKNQSEILKNKELISCIENYQKKLNGVGRIVVRTSGTEPCIRVMVESSDDKLSNDVANEIARQIKFVDMAD